MNFPEAMMPYYVGVSSEKRQGVRSRLSSHARGKGNKDIARRIAQSEPLWFVTAEGAEWIEYEALFLLLKTKGAQFGSNVRDELEPSSKRQRERVRASMTENDRNFYDHLDFDGRGL